MALLLHSGIFLCTDEGLEEYQPNAPFNVIKENPSFRKMLITLAKGQEIPLLYHDKWEVFYTCISKGDAVLISGPLCIRHLESVELRQYYREYGMCSGTGPQIPTVPFSFIVAAAQLLASEFTSTEFTAQEILTANHLEEEYRGQTEREYTFFELWEEEHSQRHHTYQEERQLLECVKEGNADEAVRLSGDLDMTMGRLGRKDIVHWGNSVVASITLCVRAAIEGGISPAAAYHISDFYIQKIEGCKKVVELIELRNRAIRDLTNRVKKKKENRKYSNYIEQCKDYISEHYKEKIYLKDIADNLEISSTYLSRLFSQETGMCLQEYINSFRVERAANLLLYSEESISYIGEYVNFPSQSYFGRIFRKYKHMTPKQYRDRYKPAEFVSTGSGRDPDI